MARPRKFSAPPVAGVAFNEPAPPVAGVGGADGEDDTPAAVRVVSLYAYWGEDGNLRRWAEGTEVTDPDEIADLIKRGAPVEEV